MSLSDKLNDIWANKVARVTIIAMVVGGALYGASQFMTDDTPKPKTVARRKAIESNIFDSSTVQVVQKEQADEYYAERKKQLEDKSRELDAKAEKSSRENAKIMARLEKLQLDMEKTKREMALIGRNSQLIQDGVTGPVNSRVTRANETGFTGQQMQASPVQQGHMQPRQYQQITRPRAETSGMIRTITQSRVSTIKKTGEVEEQPIEVVYVDGKGKKATKPKETGKTVKNPEIEKKRKAMIKEKAKTFLPAGSIVSGVMLNGVDAPTALSKTATPLAVTIRVKLDVLLPNQYTADLQDCFISGSVLAGELASERVYIRSLNLSCINTAGEAFETPMLGYAVSDYDGKQGIRGTVISRAGKALLATFGASFLSAVAQATKPTPVGALNTSPSGETTFQTPNTGDVAQAGVYGGISGGSDRLAQYAITIAEQQWPVIEISPGTPVTFFLEQGMSLPVSG